MAAQTPERRQVRARATRRALLRAARRTFAQEGFELARIEDIATLAGKSRGAFYDNFQSKEDVFFALIEEDLDRDLLVIRRTLAPTQSREQQAEQLARYLLSVCRDSQRMLLNLEFKLYAIRHPSSKRRLHRLHAAMALRCAEVKIDHLWPELVHASAQRKRSHAALLSAALEGLALNHLFDAGALPPAQMLQLLRASVAIADARQPNAPAPAPAPARQGRHAPKPRQSGRRAVATPAAGDL